VHRSVLVSQKYGAANNERKTLGGEVDPGDPAKKQKGIGLTKHQHDTIKMLKIIAI